MKKHAVSENVLSFPDRSFRTEDIHGEKLKRFPANSGLNIKNESGSIKTIILFFKIMHCMIQMRQSPPDLGT